jgi:hypothetical protein
VILVRAIALAFVATVLLLAVACAPVQRYVAPVPRPSEPQTSAPSANATTTLTPADIPPLPPPDSWVAEVANPWFPLERGSVRTYEGVKDGHATVDVYAVTRGKKVILGVPATVVRDTLRTKAGKLIEDTEDWYAQDASGNVWYLGEATKSYKDDGKTVESTEGSWQAGVDGARAGVFMPAEPTVGFQQYQEYYKGQAEDQFQVISVDATVSVPAGTFSGVLLTEETTALEPGVVSNKYYVRNVGQVYEVGVKGEDEYNKLVAIKR